VVSVLTTAGVTADRLFRGKASYPWMGDIAELVIYTEPLTGGQRKSVEDYLALKYASYVATVGAPEFTPNGATFTDSVEVTIASPTPGAEMYYTTDGTEPTESSVTYTDPLVLTSPTLVQARAFRAGMSASPVSVAHFVRAVDLSPASVPGLILWARADVGVTMDGTGQVSVWRDVSGRGNDLGQATAEAQPMLVPDVQAGLPAVHLDGVDDVLLFKTRLTSVRTVFWVVREQASASNGLRFLLGDTSSYDFHSGGTRQIWSASTSAAVLAGETRANGVVVDGRETNRPTDLSVISLVTTGDVRADAFSRDRTYGRSWWGDLAELIIYDRPLSSVERKAVEDHLALKYALYVPTLDAPTITPNGSTSSAAVQVSLAAAPGSVVYYTLDGSEPSDSSTQYVDPLVLTTPTTVRARAYRAGSNPSPIATARFLNGDTPAPARVAGLKLWVKADAGVVVSGGLVSAWADQSGAGNHLVQATPSNQPLFVEGAANGRPVVRFDGQGDVLSFAARLTAIRTVFWVVRADPASTTNYRFLLGDASAYDFCSGSTSAIWHSTSTSASIRTGETRLNGTLVNGTTTNRPTSMAAISVITTATVTADAFSRDRSYGRSWWGDLAELIIYDRPLSDSERQAVEGYLAEKYALWVPTVAAPTISPTGGLLSGPTIVQIDSATAGAEIRYTLDDTEPTDTSPLYEGSFEVTTTTRVRTRAFFAGWNPSPESVATFFGPEEFTPASLPNLALWVRGDAGLDSDEPAAWMDQSGAANDLLQSSGALRPARRVDEAIRMPLLRFDGVDDTMLFRKRLTAIRTVFWVVRADPASTANYRVLLGDATAYNFHSGVSTFWHSSSTSASIREGTTRLNGLPINGVQTNRPTDLSVISLVTVGNVTADAFSRDRTYGRSWWGDLAELVIYERDLGIEEVRSVEAYLAGRYGISMAP
jgi:hypothetical protein